MARKYFLPKLGNEELVVLLDETKDDLFNLRFQRATGQLDNTNLIKQTRREVARIHTELRIREIAMADRRPLSGAKAGRQAQVGADVDAEATEETDFLRPERKGRLRRKRRRDD